MCIPKKFIACTLYDVHDAPTAGHQGIKKTLKLAQRNYYWPTLSHDVKRYVKACDICQQTKTTTNKNTGLLQPLEVPETPTHTYSLDFIGPLPETEDGNDFIMTVVDHLTGYCVFIPTQQKLTACAAATLLRDHIIKYFGFLQQLVSNHDVCFTADTFCKLHQQCGIWLNTTSGYHPPANGKAEAANKHLMKVLHAYATKYGKNWD